MNIDKAEARKKTNLPQDKKIAIYSGHLYDWKGVDTMAKTAIVMPDILFVFVGGSDQEREGFAKRVKLCDNILIIGQRPHNEIPLYLKAADVLILPNSCQSANPRFADYSLFDTSPIKMFEYMASGRPIIASDLPSLWEVLNKKNAIFVESDNSDDLARAIRTVFGGEKFGEELASQANKDVLQYSWGNRAKIILDFIERIFYEDGARIRKNN